MSSWRARGLLQGEIPVASVAPDVGIPEEMSCDEKGGGRGSLERIDRSLYRGGIRFACQGSAKCCRFRPGYDHVYVSLDERRDLARALGMRTSSFTRKYCRRSDGNYELRATPTSCIFLRENRCSVYDARPGQCRSWPFWPENMTRKVWSRDVAPFCPGVGRGHVIAADTIDRILREQIRRDAAEAD